MTQEKRIAVRFPVWLLDATKRCALVSRRSLNSEILMALERWTSDEAMELRHNPPPRDNVPRWPTVGETEEVRER